MTRLRDALEAALRDNPDDLAAAMAWADHAAESGDPRGEFAQVQIALEDASRSPAERRDLEKREAELLARHRDEWLGPMAVLFSGDEGEISEGFAIDYFRASDYTFRFARGWLTAMNLDQINPAIVEAVAACPTAALLREFAVNGEDHDNPAFADIAELPFFGTLRTFGVGLDGRSHVDGDTLPAAIAKMSRLEDLRLYSQSPGLDQVFALPLRHLRTLIAHHALFYPLDVLAANASLGNLVTLDCFAHALRPEDDDAYIRSESFVRLAQSPHLDSLRELTIQVHEIGDAGVHALIASGMLRQLRTLDLWSGNITDDGARALAASGMLGGLTKLVLSENYLTDEGIALLRATGVPLEAERMYDPDDDDREHLWNGDME